MKNFIVHNKQGKILRTGSCQEKDFKLQGACYADEFVMEGIANDMTQKIVNGQIINKTPEEIRTNKPPEPAPVPLEKRPARITNEQWKDVLDQLDKLKTRSIKTGE